MNKRYWSHYTWLDIHFETFLAAVGGSWKTCGGIITAHGDKCYSYKRLWEDASVPFSHGVAIYLLSYLSPWSKEVRETAHGWVAPCQWVIDNYSKFKPFLSDKDLDKVEE